MDDRQHHEASTTSSPTMEAAEADFGEPEAEDDAMSDHEMSRVEKVLSRMASRRSNASSVVTPAPDGGLVAWVQVIVGHFVVLNTWGYINSFGVFQSYYVETLGHSSSDVSWIGSVQIFLLFGVGTFSGRALDYGLFRPCLALGLVLQTIGTFMTSLSTKYYQVFLAQAVCTGIGDGLMFCPTIGLVSTYFSTHKGLAIAIVACGSATGGLIFPAMVRQLLPSIGFPWTVRALGFVQLGLNALALAFLRTRLPPRKTGSLVDRSAFRDHTYTLFLVGMFFSFWAIYFAFFYVGLFTVAEIGFSYTDSINLIFVINAAGIPARILPAWIADRWTGQLNMLVPICLVSGVIVYGMAGVTSSAGVYAWTVVYGLVANGIQSLWPTTLSVLTPDPKKTGTRMGMGFTLIGFACLTGPPIAGALVQQDHGGYLYAQMWAGSSLVLGSAVLLAARYARVGWQLRKRV